MNRRGFLGKLAAVVPAWLWPKKARAETLQTVAYQIASAHLEWDDGTLILPSGERVKLHGPVCRKVITGRVAFVPGRTPPGWNYREHHPLAPGYIRMRSSIKSFGSLDRQGRLCRGYHYRIEDLWLGEGPPA